MTVTGPRREFPRRIKFEILKRATNAAGQIVCEGCGLVLGAKRFDFDHTLPEGLVVDKAAELTAADGKLLGKKCCHDPKTAIDVGRIAKADRQTEMFRGIGKRSSKPMPGTKASGIKRHMDGRVTWR